MSNVETYPVTGTAYPKGHKNGHLTHAVISGRPLCNRVKAENILDDGEWDGPGCLDRKPTCPHCLKLDTRKHE